MSNRIFLLGVSLFVLYTIVLSTQMHAIATAGNTIIDVDFDSPFDNTLNLGNPFLVEYDNTTSLQPPPNPNYDFNAVFSGYGIINGTRYTDTGVSSYDIRDNGTVVYQNGTIAITTEAGEKATLIFESLGQRDPITTIVFDHGVMFFSTNSTTGELASLNNTVYVYKDKIDERRGNLTTILWKWNGGNATNPTMTSTDNANMLGEGNATNATTTSASGGGGGGGDNNKTTASVSIVPGASTLTTDAFSPNPIQVTVGTTVTWTNNDAEPHTVNAGENATPSGLFDSYIPPTRTSEYTFTEAGEYPYFCILHPNMIGTVIVVADENNSQSTAVGNTTATTTRSDDGTLFKNELNLMQ
jgi:plastocyanin